MAVQSPWDPQLIRKEPRVIHHDTGLSWLLIILALMLLALAIHFFGQTGGIPSDTSGAVISTTPTDLRQQRIYTVSYRVGVFSPTNLRIHAGDTVRFHNDGNFPIHVVADDSDTIAGFDSIGDIPPGSSFTFTFAARGIFGYHNARNTKETGTIIVR